MQVIMEKYPTDEDWLWVKKNAFVTIGKDTRIEPDPVWRHKILVARHSPIRELEFRFYLKDIPYFVSTHLARHHVGIQPYVQSQRNDRQNNYDRNAARQDAPVDMRLTINAESMMTLANKRLCMQSAKETRYIVDCMCSLVKDCCPEFDGCLVPMCEYHGGVCHEMKPCGKCDYDGMNVKD